MYKLQLTILLGFLILMAPAAPLFIGSCVKDYSIPRSKPKLSSRPDLRINKNLYNNRGGVLLRELGEDHEYIMNTIIEPLFQEELRHSEKNDWRQQIETVLKVRNTPEKVSRFEEQAQAQEDSQTGPCSMANLDILWRFYGASLSCSLGSRGSNPTLRLCNSDECGLCSVLRLEKGGICTTTSSMALKYIGDVRVRKAVILCKVVAGRIDLTSSEKEHDELSGFNSKVNRKWASCVRNSSALLPTYVVIYKSRQRNQAPGDLH